MHGYIQIVRRGGLALLCVLVLAASAHAQFETRIGVSAVASPSSIAVGDFNRDGKLDFADATNNLQVFLGKGDGTFQAPTNYLTGTGALFVVTADFNHDGKLDLAVADLNGLFVLMGSGDGTFETPVAYSTACIPIFVGTGDFNGDHKLDLLVTYSSGNCPYVSIFFGNGDGTFQEAPTNTSPSYSPAATGIGDFNHDGKLDLAVAEQFGGLSQVEILLGNGNGTFSAGAVYTVDADPFSIAVSDFRNDGKLDLAVAALSGVTDILLGSGDGTFQPNGYSRTPDAVWVIADDFNGDGKPDLAVASEGFPPGVNVLLGNGDGTFRAPAYYPVGTNDPFVAAGDFNNDHKIDLIVPDYRYGTVYVLLNTGAASFLPTTPLNFNKQATGTTSAPQTVTLTNTGRTALSIASIKVAGQFAMSSTCRKSVAAGANCKISVTFSPKTQGPKSGTVSIIDSASSKPQVIELSGTGT
jgi:hypothetical protein